jgi:hypothetical protein
MRFGRFSGKTYNASISENTIVSNFDIVSVYTNIDVATSEQLSKNAIEENYHQSAKFEKCPSELV